MKEFVKDWLEAILEACIIICIMHFALFPFKVNGESMQNTLNDGDTVFVSRIMATLNMYEKGDLVVFDQEIDGDKIKMVKRVIAVEGDQLLLKDGKLYLNGELQNEIYAIGVTEGNVNLTVEHGQIIVFGDNRENSMDSRDFGAVDKENIKGCIVLKMFPFNDFKIYK